jgi:hypothetical protein
MAQAKPPGPGLVSWSPLAGCSVFLPCATGKKKTDLPRFPLNSPWPFGSGLQVTFGLSLGGMEGPIWAMSWKEGPGPADAIMSSLQCEAERALPEHHRLPGHHQEQPGQSSGQAVGDTCGPPAMGSAEGSRSSHTVEGEPHSPFPETFPGGIFYK